VKQKVLIIGPGVETRGGITRVIEFYQSTFLWEKWNCKWIVSYIDKNAIYKIFYFIMGFLSFLKYVPHAKIVHIHLSEPMSAFRKSFFFIFAKMFRKKTIIHFHSFSPETSLLSRWSFIYRYMFSNADVVVVLSEWWKDEVLMATHPKSICVILNPCETVTIKRSHEKENQYILFAGTLNKRKGFTDLIEAFSLIANKCNYNLVFAGNGNMIEGLKLVESLKIYDRVTFLGWVKNEEKQRTFKNASIFCLPSYAEGFPMALLDAAAYGLPIVSTPVNGIKDYFIDNESILFFAPGNIKEMSEKLLQLINNDEQRMKLSLNVKNIADTIFSIEIVAQELDKLYMKI
jgi:glycosyltransferase involved in cell wall biosynthesis